MPDEDAAPARRRKAYSLATTLKMSRQDRLDFAEVLLWQDVASWGDLGDPEICRLLDAMEGFVFLTALRQGALPARTRPAPPDRTSPQSAHSRSSG
jgi:hypothetical protein